MKKNFTLEFLEEFQFDAEFHALLTSMERGLITPYQAIEHLCKSKKTLSGIVTKVLENYGAPKF